MGPGTFAVTGTTGNFNVGVATTSGTGTSILDMSGLSNFSANVGTFAVASTSTSSTARQSGVLTLGGTNTITATTVTVGSTDLNSAAATGVLNLGQTNTINADTINVGAGKTSGTVQLRSGISGATLTIAKRDGSPGANLNVGINNVTTGGTPVSTVDFSGVTLSGTFGTITLGRGASGSSGSNTGTGTGNLIFSPGSFNATTIVSGTGGSSSAVSGVAIGIGNITMNANAGTLTATNVILGAGSSTNGATGTFTQNGGTANITTLTLGNRTTGTVTSTYNLNGGTLKAGTIQAGTGTATRNFVWTSGTIQNLSGSDLTIASGLALTATSAGSHSFTADAGRSITVNGTLTGTSAGVSGFSKDGAGTLTLTASNSYTGQTTINGGLLSLTSAGSIASSSGLVLNSGTFSGRSSVTAVTVANSSSNLLTNTSGNVLTIGSLTFNGAAAVNVNMTGAPGLVVSGALTTTPASGQVTLSGSNSLWANGVNNLITFGSFTGNISDFTTGSFSGFSGRQTAGTLQLNGNAIALNVIGDSPVWTGANGNIWTTGTTGVVGTTPNWALLSTGSATDFWPSDTVQFNDQVTLNGATGAPSTTSVVIHGGNVSPNSATFNNSSLDYTISSDDGSGIASGALVKNGTGKLTLSSSNSYTGGTTINAGTVVINSASSLGAATMNGATLQATADITSSRNFNLSGANTISVDPSMTYTIGGLIANGTSAGQLTKSGSGTLVLSNNSNTYTGITTIIGGTLSIAADTALGTAPGSAVANQLTLDGGTLAMTGGFSLAANRGVTLGTDGGTFNVVTSGSTVNVNGIVTGTGNFTKTGAGRLALTSTNNSFTGTVFLGGGILTINPGDGALGNTANGITFTADTALQKSSGSGAITLNSGRTITINNGVTATFDVTNGTIAVNGNVVGSGALTKTGAGILTLAGTNTYSGNTTVSAGTLAVNGAIAATSGTATVASGATLNGSGTIDSKVIVSGALSGSLTINGDTQINNGATAAASAFNGNVLNDGTITNNLAIASSKTLSGSGTNSGTTTITGGTLSPGSGASSAAAITLNNTVTLTNSTYLVNIDGANSDVLTINGNLDLSAANDVLTLSILNSPTLSSYTIATYTGTLTDTFADVSSLTSQGYSIDYGAGSNSAIIIAAVPEPSTWAMMIGGVGMLGFYQKLRRNRRKA